MWTHTQIHPMMDWTSPSKFNAYMLGKTPTSRHPYKQRDEAPVLVQNKLILH
jgi:hypothetical protein